MTSLYRNYHGDFTEDSTEYLQHINAMTAENLNSKSDIAAELAWRDSEIAELKGKIEIMKKIYKEDCNDEIKKFMRGY